eukprot:CAMPEP_0168347558 /NCGR_PEP_ID=MMETSP0213-20121227/19084_1 /TAXON_ID=151035 /ORGANISM="Euplotes harpa, Strain FSP1.4" /LENGTH=49 /DNA_ID= /DNA_START= /DNA_END= /DNA_ORIENTATION=
MQRQKNKFLPGVNESKDQNKMTQSKFNPFKANLKRKIGVCFKYDEFKPA